MYYRTNAYSKPEKNTAKNQIDTLMKINNIKENEISYKLSSD